MGGLIKSLKDHLKIYEPKTNTHEIMEIVRRTYPPRSLIFGFHHQPSFSCKSDYVRRRIIFNKGQAIRL